MEKVIFIAEIHIIVPKKIWSHSSAAEQIFIKWHFLGSQILI